MKKILKSLKRKNVKARVYKAIISSGIFAGILLGALTGCTSTLQEDIFDSTEASALMLGAISEYEEKFIVYDAEYTMKGKIESSGISELHTNIENKLSQTHEPALLAHLQAMDGLLYYMENKTKRAQDFYKEAKTNQSDDIYVLLLGIRLEKTTENSLAKMEEILSYDGKNGTIMLEKGKLLYKKNQYDKAVAALDNAFLIFDGEKKPKYREVYKPFRDNVWKLYSAGIDDSVLNGSLKSADLAKPLTKDLMLKITMENTKLLEDFTGGGKISNAELTKKLTSYGVFSAAIDKNNSQNTAFAITNSNAISRIMAARYIWNLYVKAKGKPEMLTRYSTRYAKMANPKSPIKDVDIKNPDFDAVLGVVETELMELPDGKSFQPDNILTGVDFLAIIKKVE